MSDNTWQTRKPFAMATTPAGEAFSDDENAGFLSAEDEPNEFLSAEDDDDDENAGFLSAEDEDDAVPTTAPQGDEVTPTGYNSLNPFTLAAGAATAVKDAVSAYTGLPVDHASPSDGKTDDSSEKGEDSASPDSSDDVEQFTFARLLSAGSNYISQLTPDLSRTHKHPRTFEIDGIPCHQWKITDETKYEAALTARLPTDIREQIERLNPDERTYAWSVCMHAADGPLRFMPRSNHPDMDVEISLKFGRPDSWKMNDDVSVDDAIMLNNHVIVPNKRLRKNHNDSQVTFVDVSGGDNDNTVREFGKVEDLDDYYVRPNHKKYYDGETDDKWVAIGLTLAQTAWYTCRDVPTFAVYHPDHRCVWKDAAFKEKGSALEYRQLITSKYPEKVQEGIIWEKGKDKNGNLNKNKVVSIVWDSRPDNPTEYGTIKSKIIECKDVPPCAPRDYANHKDERWCLVFEVGIYFCPYENKFMKAKYGDTSHLARVTYQTMVAAIDNQHLDTEDFVELKSATYELGLKRAAKETKLKFETSVVNPIKEGVRTGVNSFVDNVVAPVKEAVVAVATDNVLRPAKTVYDTAHHVATTVKDFSLNPFAKTQYIERFKALAKDHWLMWGCATVALEIAAHHFEIDKLLDISKTALHSTIGVVALIIVDGINGGTILNEVKSMALDATTRLSKVVAGAGVASVLGAVAVGASPLALVGMLSSATGIATLAKKFAGNQAMWKALLITIISTVGPVSNGGLMSILGTLYKKTHLGIH